MLENRGYKMNYINERPEDFNEALKDIENTLNSKPLEISTGNITTYTSIKDIWDYGNVWNNKYGENNE